MYYNLPDPMVLYQNQVIRNLGRLFAAVFHSLKPNGRVTVFDACDAGGVANESRSQDKNRPYSRSGGLETAYPSFPLSELRKE
jgi:hypothetical protein